MSDRIKPVLFNPDAVTATTTFSALDAANATKITCLFKRADHSSGSSKFEVLGSLDGTTFSAVMLIQTIAADAGVGATGVDIGYTRALDTTMGANGTEVWAVDLKYMNFKEIKIRVTETTDGTHSCQALIEY